MHPEKFMHHGLVGDSVFHPSHGQIGIRPINDKLYVVTVMNNPHRFLSRYKNYWAFEKRVRDAGAELYTVELAFGDRAFEITQRDDPLDIQLRTRHELWYKENLVNIGIQRLPTDWQYVCWIDADVTFARPDWAQETMQLLQHYDVIQMFSHAQDLGPNHEPISTTAGFVYQWEKSRPLAHTSSFDAWGKGLTHPPYPYYGGPIYGHPGFCWAARRSAIDSLGGLIDWAILGSADYHMATALIGSVKKSISPMLHDRYVSMCLEWQNRAERNIRRNIGHLPGTVSHYWHGRKQDRLYNHRWKCLVNAEFNPDVDLKMDWQGIWQLTGDNVNLRDALRDYAMVRNEDSTDS